MESRGWGRGQEGHTTPSEDLNWGTKVLAPQCLGAHGGLLCLKPSSDYTAFQLKPFSGFTLAIEYRSFPDPSLI